MSYNDSYNMNATDKAPKPEIGEYNGKPVITLKRTEIDKYPFSFGLGKARLIVQHFEAIKKFVADNPAKS